MRITEAVRDPAGMHLSGGADEFPDLAPGIFRQRLVIEGLTAAPIGAPEIIGYLKDLSDICGMITLIEPVTHRSDTFGWAGWIHWESSGAHFYAWDDPKPFFSVDIYTCKAFNPERVLTFTARYLHADRVVGKSF